jgi:hypothetical protein
MFPSEVVCPFAVIVSTPFDCVTKIASFPELPVITSSVNDVMFFVLIPTIPVPGTGNGAGGGGGGGGGGRTVAVVAVDAPEKLSPAEFHAEILYANVVPDDSDESVYDVAFAPKFATSV